MKKKAKLAAKSLNRSIDPGPVPNEIQKEKQDGNRYLKCQITFYCN